MPGQGWVRCPVVAGQEASRQRRLTTRIPVRRYRDQVDGAELGSVLVAELPGAGECFEPSFVMW